MNAEKVRARIKELEQQSEQLRADLNAVGGAIQDCQFWLQQLEAEGSSDDSD